MIATLLILSILGLAGVFFYFGYSIGKLEGTKPPRIKKNKKPYDYKQKVPLQNRSW